MRSIIKSFRQKQFEDDDRLEQLVMLESEKSNEDTRMSSVDPSRKIYSSTSFKKVSAQKSNIDTFGNAFVNLTNTETFNNLIGTYSAITIILRNIYEKYYSDKNFAEMVDSMSGQGYSYPGCATDNVRQYFKLSELPSNIKDDFCSFMAKDERLTDLECEITEYSSALFQNIRTVNSLSSESLYNSLNPRANENILLKSFEKTSAKGGKPLIKTHDKKFLIKEISEEERDFFLSLVKNYHSHLHDNPRSLLAKIYGCFSIRVNNKNKVYHILMENLDPLDDQFILFKYDMKFSTLNRKEISSNSTIRSIINGFTRNRPWTRELFNGYDEIMRANNVGSRSSGGFQAPMYSKNNTLDKVIEEDSDDSFEMNQQDDNTTTSKVAKLNKLSDESSDEEEKSMKKDIDDNSPLYKNHSQNTENSSVIMRLSVGTKKSKVMKGAKALAKDQNSSSQFLPHLHTTSLGNFNDNLHSVNSQYEDEQDYVDAATLKKLGLLKDEDFMHLHKCLCIDADSEMEVEMMNASIEKDVKFLHDLNIMDYSLFVVIIEAPEKDPLMRSSKSEFQDSESDDE